MPLKLAPRIVDALLLGQGDRRRQLQDFPILADVWALYAERPGEPHDLLLAPRFGVTAARVAAYLDRNTDADADDRRDRRVAHLHGIVAARLTLSELWTLVLPATGWWRTIMLDDGEPFDAVAHTLARDIEELLAVEVLRGRGASAPDDEKDTLQQREQAIAARTSRERQLIRLALLIGCLAAADEDDGSTTTDPAGDLTARLGILGKVEAQLGRVRIGRLGEKALWQARALDLVDVPDDPTDDDDRWRGLIYNVSINRPAGYATARSVPAIKADAARQLFAIRCAEINWAVIDSGIDAAHPAFFDQPIVPSLDKDAASRGGPTSKTEQLTGAPPSPSPLPDAATAKPIGSRVKAIYDFSDIRAILSGTNRYNRAAREKLAADLATKVSGVEDIEARILSLSEAAFRGRPVDWSTAEPLLRRRPDEKPANPHGTHVAGIIGGNYWKDRKLRQQGVCPDIGLYDLRVLGPDAEQSEFAVIAALQFVRYLNTRSGFAVIDGVNLSLSIPHNVRNYACGKTPVCLEAEALAAAGTVVVAAAGNRGYQSFRLSDDSSFESYAASTITDPGNADGVITVGSTHRYSPHTYGVSFFSGRGPTGDGRMKPDILAPGERIESAVPGGEDGATDAMDGTSMAAPHVSGAAALLMARHSELRGRPARIKEVLCATATDLGRERSFQGHGMVDVLRAIQSI